MKKLLFVIGLFITLVSQGQPRPMFLAMNEFGCAVSDPDVCAYLQRLKAAGYTATQTEAGAVNTFVTTIKVAGIYAKLTEFWLYIGAAEAPHSLGFKNAYNLIFNGFGLHDALGAHFNGTSQFANTTLPFEAIGSAYAHLSYYSQTDGNSGNGTAYYDMGVGTAGVQLNLPQFAFSLNIRRSNTLTSFDANTFDAGRLSGFGVVSDTRGFFIGSRVGATDTRMYRNGTQILSSSAPVGPSAPPFANEYIHIGGWHEFSEGNGATNTFYYNVRTTSFNSVGVGLTPSEVTAFSAAVNTLQTTLNRNTY